MSELVGFAGGSLFVLLCFCTAVHVLAELKVFRGDTTLCCKSMTYAFCMMAICMAVGLIYYSVAVKNTGADYFKNVWAKTNDGMNGLMAEFSFASLKSSEFMPLYPLLVKVAGWFCFGRYEFVAVMVSTLFMGLSVYILSLVYGKPGLYLLIFPLAYTGFAALPFSMALMFAVLVFYAIKKDRPLLCLLFCVLLILTDWRGVCILLPLVLWAGRTKRLLVTAVAALLAIFLYLIYGGLPAAPSRLPWLLPVYAALLVAMRKKETDLELSFGVLLAAAGLALPFARPDLLMALPFAVALQSETKPEVKYFAAFAACVLLGYILIFSI